MTGDLAQSPLQLKQLLFHKIHVEAARESTGAESMWAPDFDFEGISITVNLMVGHHENQADDPREYIVRLTLSVKDEPESGKFPPYIVDVEAEGYFELQPVFEIEERDSIVRVNGGSVVVGAIRELITQLTARSVFGPMTLPTLRFLKDAPSSDT